MTLKIHEIFHSIQGESSRIGLPTTFVRLTGCPMRCVYCDTAYAFSGGSTMSLAAIMLKVAELGAPYVILDIKTPGSGELAKNLWSNLALLKASDEVKFVLCDRADYDWAKQQLGEHKLNQTCPVIFSPVYSQVNPSDLAAWVLADKLPVRMQVQLHKILWGEKPGV